MTIQWFPGHMAKAMREMKEKRSQIDVIIEVLDARIPLSSRNPVLAEVFSGKPRLIILNKEDLANPTITQQWCNYFKNEKTECLAINSRGNNRKKIEKIVRELIPDPQKRIIKSAIFGVPNVGKSSLINHLIGKKKVIAGDKPGVTKKQIWVPVSHSLLLLDSPGILWPKFEDPKTGLNLAITHCIKEIRYNSEEVATVLCEFILNHAPTAIPNKYKIDTTEKTPPQIFEEIGKKRGCFIAGNNLDLDRVHDLFLREFRSGKLGRLSLELPPTQAK